MAGRGALDHLLRADLTAERVAADDRAPGRTAQLLVPGALDALEAAVRTLEADHVRGQLTVGIEAQRVRDEAEAGLAERPHLIGHRGRQAALEPDERLLGGEEPVQDRFGHGEERGEARGDTHGVTHGARLREERLRAGGGRERGAAAVHDRTAPRVQRDRTRVLALRERRELGMAHHLQGRQPRQHPSERDGEDRRQDQDPRPERGIHLTAHARFSPDHALRADEASRGHAARATGDVFTRQSHLLAARYRHAELTRAGLHAAGRAEGGDLDLELADQDLDARPFAAKGVELVGEVHLLHAQADDDEEPHHEEGGAQERHGERAPQAQVGITMETLTNGRVS